MTQDNLSFLDLVQAELNKNGYKSWTLKRDASKWILTARIGSYFIEVSHPCRYWETPVHVARQLDDRVNAYILDKGWIT